MSAPLVATALPGLGDLTRAEIAAKRAARMSRIGPPIASGEGFEIHSPQALGSRGSVTCGIKASADDLEALGAVFSEKRAAVDAWFQKESRRIQEEQRDVTQQLMRPGGARPSPQRIQRLAARNQELLEESNALAEEHRERVAAIDSEMASAREELGAAELSLVLLHDPTGARGELMPMEGLYPTIAFEAELLGAIRPFLDTCPPIRTIWLYHYYRDGFRWGERDRPVISFRVDRKKGRWAIWRGGVQGSSGTGAAVPVLGRLGNRSELTFPGYQAESRRLALVAAAYRRWFDDASMRREGIVYKSDDYWKEYDGFDTARRVFDGDFVGHEAPVDFEANFMALAEVYSRRCAADVESFVEYRIPTREYVGSETQLDGSTTRYYADRILKLRIDSRFDPQWAQFRPRVNASLIGDGMRSLAEGRPIPMGILRRPAQFSAMIERHSCTSATVRQMVDNFLRAAKGRPSAQEAGRRFSGADVESDPPRSNP